MNLARRSETEATAALGGAESDGRPSDRAYLRIRNAILTGELGAGTRLREEPLADLTETSRTPVRAALERLVAEGLARVEGRNRYVIDHSSEETAVVFEIRARLESLAARLAAERIEPDELAMLEETIERIDEVEPLDPAIAADRFVTLNGQFHDIILTASRSHQLTILGRQAASLPLVLLKSLLWRQGIGIARSNAQHRDILLAITEGNGDWAAAAMASHVLSTRPRIAPKPEHG